MNKYILFITLLFISFHSLAQGISGVFYDSRDGKEYETVIMEFELAGGVSTTREWFASNLNFEMEKSYCYKNYSEYCDIYGRLYSWDAAREACPSDWHISTVNEWELLTNKYGGSKVAAGEMKEGGESELNIIMAGFGEQNGLYIDVGVNGYYWNTAKVGGYEPGLITFHTGEDYFSADQINQTHRNSVRCVKNYDTAVEVKKDDF